MSIEFHQISCPRLFFVKNIIPSSHEMCQVCRRPIQFQTFVLKEKRYVLFLNKEKAPEGRPLNVVQVEGEAEAQQRGMNHLDGNLRSQGWAEP